MINLYYDNIYEGLPAPNGSQVIDFTKDARRVPFIKNHTSENPIAKLNTFYFVAKANKTVINLYTGKPKKVRNLFYPIELNYTFYSWNRSWIGLISPRAEQLIRKGRMKLLILAPRVTGNSYIVSQMKERIDELIASGIPRSSIVLVLGELNNVYRKLVQVECHGIDWWQIYMQLVYKVKLGESSLSWICDDEYLKSVNDIPKIDYDSWRPNKIFNIEFTNYFEHDLTLFLDIVMNDLTDDGYYNLEHTNYSKIRTLSNMIVDPKAGTIEKLEKQRILDSLHTYPNKNTEDKHSDSLFTIICDDTGINVDTYYKDELAAFRLGPLIWKYIIIGHPFAIVGCPGTHEYLNNQGYFTCNEIINQRYDSAYTPAKRVKYIVKNIKELKNVTQERYNELLEESIPFLKKNKETFLKKRMQPKFLDLFIDLKYN